MNQILFKKKKEMTLETLLAGNTVKLEQDATRLVTCNTKNRGYGKPALPCSFGGSSYYDLCDFGVSINIIPYELYL